MNLKKYKWKYRLLLIETPDYKNENYILAKTIFEKNIKKFHKRYLKLIIRKKKFIDFNIKEIDNKIKLKVNEAADFAIESELPDEAELFKDIIIE